MKWLKIFAWIVFPYIMILFAWKRFGVVQRTAGVLWALFILIVTIVPKDTPTETAATSTAPQTAAVQTKAAEPKTLAPSTPKVETKKPTVSKEANVKKAEKTTEDLDDGPPVTNARYDYILEFPADKYPQTAAHIAAAFKAGKSQVCTIDRNGADTNRDASLAGLATKAGYDRDEWPMAMCAEGGAGADIAYVELSDNRGSGSWVGSRLRDYEDGTRVLFVLDGTSDAKVVAAEKEAPAAALAKEPVKVATPAPEKKPVVEKAPVVATPAPKPQPKPEPKPEPAPEPEPVPVAEEPEVEYTFYENCSAVRAAGADPIEVGDPGYSRKLDRDGDGVGCEK